MIRAERKSIIQCIPSSLHEWKSMDPHPRRERAGQHLCLGQLFTRALAGLESLRVAGPRLLVLLINKRSQCSRPVLFVREMRLDSCWMYAKEGIHASRCLIQIFNYCGKSTERGALLEWRAAFIRGMETDKLLLSSGTLSKTRNGSEVIG